MLKVAVLGAGTMGTVHSKAYSRMDRADLVGIVDMRPAVGKKLADSCNTNAYTSLDALLAEQNPDVIDVCLPTYLHRTYVERAAELGKHVVCEKPIARSLEDADSMILACMTAGVRLFVGHVVRFFPEYREMKSIIDSGKIGTVGTVRTFRGGGFPTGWEDWYASVERSGSLVVDLAIHDFDFLRWCFGKVERVYAKSLHGRDANRMDHALVSLRFESGVIGHLEASWAEPSGFHTSFEAAGTGGIVSHNSDEATPVHSLLRGGHANTHGGVAVPDSPLLTSPYFTELEHFLTCIETGESSIVTAEDAYHALQISLAANQSIRTGEVVHI